MPERPADPAFEREVAGLGGLPRTELVARWERVVGAALRANMSTPLLRRALAHEIQRRRWAKADRAVARRLRTTASDSPGSHASAKVPRLGDRLIREWNGRTYVVDVVDGGFVLDDATYSSLSAVARAITGARWSGPRFFGLDK